MIQTFIVTFDPVDAILRRFPKASRMNIEQTTAVKCDSDEPKEEADWQYKYRSAFTYAAYNDLDRMGYQAPKRYGTQVNVYVNQF